MTRLCVSLGALLPALLASGCGDPKAPEKCDALVEAICANFEEDCFTPMSAETCYDEVDGMFDCADAFDVSESYDACISEVSSSTECLSTTGLPTACEGAILALEE